MLKILKGQTGYLLIEENGLKVIEHICANEKELFSNLFKILSIKKPDTKMLAIDFFSLHLEIEHEIYNDSKKA